MNNYTIAGKIDGFGAQYQSVMSGVAICAYKNLTYVHTPFKRLLSAPSKQVKRLNHFIGIPIGDTENAFKEPFSSEVHYAERPSVYYTPDVIQKLRDWYYSVEKPVFEDVDIAIHIRRGCVKPHRKMRYTDNTTYIKVIDTLKKLYPDRKILIFSEGEISDFKELNLKPNSFRLNLSIERTFHSLVVANICITAKSSFSYAAAILNENTVYYQEYVHKKLDHWLRFESLVK